MYVGLMTWDVWSFRKKYEEHLGSEKVIHWRYLPTGKARLYLQWITFSDPKEIRRTLRIREGDPLEIFTDREGEIILKKYSPIGELAAFAGMYADSLAKEAGCLVCICDMDQVVAASGNGRKEVQEKYISKVLQGELEERNSILAKVDEKKYIRVFREQEKDYVWESITPIICEGDVVGAVILLSSDEKEKFTKLEQKLGACAAGFLGKQME